MRRTFDICTLLAIIVLSLSMLVCSDSPNEPDLRSLALSTYTWEARFAGDTSLAVTVADSGLGEAVDWQAGIAYGEFPNDAWLSLSQYSGTTPGEFVIIADPNRTYKARTARVVVSAVGVPGCPDTLVVVQEARFAPARFYPVAERPSSVIAADLDGDTDYDLAVTCQWSNEVSILMNWGSGSFYSGGNHKVGYQPLGITAIDLEGDGDIDLVTANMQSNDISVIFNVENIFLQPSAVYGVDSMPMSLCAGDFDGDGDPDIAVAGSDSSSVLVLLNNGNGIFTYGDVYPLGYWSRSICPGDFDGDGAIDLAVTVMRSDLLYQGGVVVMTNDGNADFSSQTGIWPGCPESRLVSVADLDGDDDLDWTVAGTCVSVVLNEGSGPYYPLEVLHYPQFTPSSLCHADIDMNGTLDIVVVDIGLNSLWVFFNDATLSFQDAEYFPLEDPQLFGSSDSELKVPLSVCAADLDGDGDPDLAVANGQANEIAVLINNLID